MNSQVKEQATEVLKEQAMEEGKVLGSPTPLQKKGGKHSFMWVLVLGVAVIVALAVGLSLGLKDDSDNNGNLQSYANNGNTTTTSSDLPQSNSNNESTTTTFSGLPPISSRSLQQKYESCDQLGEDLEEALRALANITIERNVRSYFYNDYGYGGPIRTADLSTGAVEAAPAPANADVADASAGIQTDESSFGTNNQVEGVDEADIVKSDGVHAFAAYGPEIIKVDAVTPKLLSRTTLPSTDEGCGQQTVGSILLIDDRLIVITSGWCNIYLEGIESDLARTSFPVVGGTEYTEVYIYDKNSMEVVDTYKINGNYVSARSIENAVYIVTNTYLNYYEFTRFLEPWNTEIYGKLENEAEYRTKAAAQVDTQMDAFVAKLTDELDCETIQEIALLQNTEDILPYAPFMDTLSTVTSFDVTKSESLTATSVFLPGGSWEVYASQSLLVLAVQGWWVGGSASQQTYFIAYRLKNAAAYGMALGQAPGYILDQFSMDHWIEDGKDYFRVATSKQQQWMWLEDDVTGVETWQPSEEESDNLVTIFELPTSDGEDMKQIAQLSGLGKPGEQIYSVRFLGKRGFIVTFEQTDPFYTLDLSVPEDPRVVGELEIPGFSSYLHPYGENIIVGVGQNVDPDTLARTGLQISMFDVSDFKNPERIKHYVEGGSDSSSSESEYNHQAFRLLEDSGLLILPVSKYSYRYGDASGSFDGFVVYSLETEKIQNYFNVSHASDSTTFIGGCWSPSYMQSRSIVVDGDLMTFKGHSILSHDLSDRVRDAEAINLDDGLTNNCYPTYFLMEPMVFPIEPSVVVDPVDSNP